MRRFQRKRSGARVPGPRGPRLDERRRRRHPSLDGGTGGTTFLGTTHRAHTGDALSCDHIFATDRSAGGQRSSGCFDAAGARLVAARRVADGDPDFVDSDHTPVVAEFSFRETKAVPADATADPFLPPGRTVSREMLFICPAPGPIHVAPSVVHLTVGTESSTPTAMATGTSAAAGAGARVRCSLNARRRRPAPEPRRRRRPRARTPSPAGALSRRRRRTRQ